MAERTSSKETTSTPPTLGEINRWFDLMPMDIDGVDGTEAKILDAARRCYVVYGAAKMSLNDVAGEAGVSRGSVYKYYSNRRELLRRVVEYGLASQMDVIDRAMATREGFENQVVCAAELMREAFIGRPPVRETTHADRVARGLTRESGPYLHALRELFGPYLRAAKAKGEVRRDLDVDQASEWLARMLLSLVAMPAQTFDYGDQADTVNFVRSFALRGLR